MWSTLKTKLNCKDRSDQVRFFTKTSKDNDVISGIGVVYVLIVLNCRDRSDQVPTLTKTI